MLFSCCVPTEESLSSKKPTPPLVVLHWGSISSFPAFVTSVSAKYTLFSSDGTPDPRDVHRGAWRRCRASRPGRTRRPAARTSAACTGPWPATRLASVAYAEYGDPAQWRALAAYNGIDDPLRVRDRVRILLLPTPEELAGRA